MYFFDEVMPPLQHYRWKTLTGRARGGGKRIFMPLEYKQKENEMVGTDLWSAGMMDMLYNPLRAYEIDKLGEKPRKGGVALSALWEAVKSVIINVNKLIAQRKEDIKEVRNKAEYDDVVALHEKVNAIARHLELEFQHKSEIKLNEYELVEPSEEEDDEDDYDY